MKIKLPLASRYGKIGIGNDHGGTMPLKVRKLKASLSKEGFSWRPSKGSHTYWTHPLLPGLRLTISGSDGDDAQKYQILDVQNALNALKKAREKG